MDTELDYILDILIFLLGYNKLKTLKSMIYNASLTLLFLCNRQSVISQYRNPEFI